MLATISMNKPVQIPDNASAVRERMISDLVASERRLRQAAEQLLGEFREVLYFLASQLAGEQVQEIKRQDPATFRSWTPQQWQAFFVGMLKRHNAWSPTNTETSPQTALKRQAENERLRQSIQSWQQRCQAAESQLQAVQQRLKELENQPSQVRPVISAPANDIDTMPGITRENIDAGVHTATLKLLRHWNVPTRPARFARLVSSEELQWRRQSMALYLLAMHGLNPRVELEHLIGVAEGLKSRSSALRRSVDLLEHNRLLITDSLHMLNPETSLALARLSDEGRDLCQVLGWKAVESDWERLLRLRPAEKKSERSLAILIVAMHARLRGWQVKAVPDSDLELPVDIHLWRGLENLLAWVLPDEPIPVGCWQKLVEKQGQVVSIARTILQRQRLAEACVTLDLPGVSTSLEELITVRLGAMPLGDELWKDRWDRRQPPGEKAIALSPLPVGAD